ncbi:transmembrane protein, putative [Medicago truncatula]|uniref:Transmembrane protein, putative n=1 Tax=Medicago truncatula TaxID=3880 RepID=A0A072V0A1_MEDTR|nr:transmembrane protein, putative [Medicago truncatula]
MTAEFLVGKLATDSSYTQRKAAYELSKSNRKYNRRSKIRKTAGKENSIILLQGAKKVKLQQGVYWRILGAFILFKVWLLMVF